jgi:hypothetical protein
MSTGFVAFRQYVRAFSQLVGASVGHLAERELRPHD